MEGYCYSVMQEATHKSSVLNVANYENNEPLKCSLNCSSVYICVDVEKYFDADRYLGTLVLIGSRYIDADM